MPLDGTRCKNVHGIHSSLINFVALVCCERIETGIVFRLSILQTLATLCAGGLDGDANVCGAMTSGGTESILSAVKASRDYMRFTKGITEPEMIIGESAHAAFYKAAEYFQIKLIRVNLLQGSLPLLQNPEFWIRLSVVPTLKVLITIATLCQVQSCNFESWITFSKYWKTIKRRARWLSHAENILQRICHAFRLQDNVHKSVENHNHVYDGCWYAGCHWERL